MKNPQMGAPRSWVPCAKTPLPGCALALGPLWSFSFQSRVATRRTSSHRAINGPSDATHNQWSSFKICSEAKNKRKRTSAPSCCFFLCSFFLMFGRVEGASVLAPPPKPKKNKKQKKPTRAHRLATRATRFAKRASIWESVRAIKMETSKLCR